MTAPKARVVTKPPTTAAKVMPQAAAAAWDLATVDKELDALVSYLNRVEGGEAIVLSSTLQGLQGRPGANGGWEAELAAHKACLAAHAAPV